MSLGVKIAVEDKATADLRKLEGRVTPQRLAAEIGPRGTRLVQRNFLSLGKNKRGWPTTNFWARAAKATNWQVGTGFVMIGVNQIGVRQQLLGGDIRPVNAQALTIPISPVAYGHTAREFPGAFLLFTPKGAYIVQHGETVSASGEVKGPTLKGKKVLGGNFKRRQRASLNFLFKLARGVSQRPHPEVMPSDEAWNKAFDESVEALLRFDS